MKATHDTTEPATYNAAADADDCLAILDSQEDLTELRTHAQAIQAWWQAQTPVISERKFFERFPRLGSARTLERLAAGQFSGKSLEFLEEYRAVADMLENGSSGTSDDPTYEDLLPAKLVVQNVTEMIAARSTRERCLMVVGDTGAGKTRSLELVLGRTAGCVLVTGNESWENSLMSLLRDLLEKLPADEEPGKREPATRRELFQEIVRRINNRKRFMLLIDEAHRLPKDNAEGINCLIDLINACPNLFVAVAAQNTLWGKLSTRSWQEAKQLFFNRTWDHLTLGAPKADEARKFLRKRCGDKCPDIGKQDADALEDGTRKYGAYAFLRRVARRLNAGHDLTAAITAARKAAGAVDKH